jgi:hypothetical protein
MEGLSMRAGTTRRWAALLAVLLLIVAAGCSGDPVAEQTTDPDEVADAGDDAGEGEGEEGDGEGEGEDNGPQMDEGNPCGPDGPDEIPGPPGEEPADDATAIDVTAVEYAFEGVEATYEAGSYAFALTNGGEEFHELILVGIDDEGERSVEELSEISDEEAEEVIEFIGGAVACPGDSADPFGADLDAGRYAIVCFIPVGFTPEADPATLDEDQPHASEGMVSEFTVEG